MEHHNEDFDNDDPDSDDEYNYFEENERAHRHDFNALNQGRLLKDVYAELCEWIVDSDSVNKHGNIFSRGDDLKAVWVRWFMLFGPGRDLIQNITNVTELHQFRDHFIALQKLNLPANIINAIERSAVVRDLKYVPREFCAHASSNQSEFDTIPVQAVTFSAKLCHVLTSSQNSAFCSEIMEHIRGLTPCIVSIRRRDTMRTDQDSRFMFSVIRSTQIRGSEVDA